jgi:hypothetical protein
MGGGAPPNIYFPPPIGQKELNLSDDWRGVWIADGELPDGIPVLYAYGMVLMGDKGYVTRRAGDAVWGTVEGDTGGLVAERFMRAAAKEQVAATVRSIEMLGYFECRATSHNADYPAGALSIRPFYLVVASKVGDLAKDSAFEKRRLPANEYLMALRKRYPELADQLSVAGQRYAVLRAKGEA